ncbi:MAG: transglutaminase family protein [Proteobacteria bacterium]|nr:transglutaminase family protein [Pseudomonadota bacterium]
MTAGAGTGRERRVESVHVTALRTLLHASAIYLYLGGFASSAGVWSAILLGTVGLLLAPVAHRHRLRLGVAALAALLLTVVVALLAERLLQRAPLAAALGIERALATADVLTFGVGGLCTLFLLRLLAIRRRIFSLLEVAFVAGSAAAALAAHRHGMIHRPRWLSDWAWGRGIDPTHALVAVGAVTTLLAALLFLRSQRLLKLLTTLALLALLGTLFFFALGNLRVGPLDGADSLGLSGRRPRSANTPRKEGSGTRDDSLFRDDYRSQAPPQPVALAILRDDFSPPGGILYFRQRALSAFNGVRLTADPRADLDVPARFPSAAPWGQRQQQRAEAHVLVPTTMYLLVDHPQPPALSHAIALRAVDNPNSRQFVAAYEVLSRVLATPGERLLGQRSIPTDWPAARIKHYTAVPDDPRYAALAREIVRQVDPRFADDELAQALAIKHFLEREGFYTRRSHHADSSDPTASFLFGDRRGYCVHFAHAAVYLLRSLGLAARVALGYAVQTLKRGGGSSVLIMGDRAHAWPELHLEGIGWVTFDIHPERTDVPAAPPIDYELEKLLGEVARHDPTAGVGQHPTPWLVPWRAVGRLAFALLWAALLTAWAIKIARRVAPRFAGEDAFCRLAYRATLDRLTELGYGRRFAETRERHAARLRSKAPHMVALTAAHLAATWGSQRAPERAEVEVLLRQVARELAQHTHPLRRLVGLINPLSWLWTR